MEHSTTTGQAGQINHFSCDPETDRIAELHLYPGGSGASLYVPGIHPIHQGMIDRGEMDASSLVTGSVLDGHYGVLTVEDPDVPDGEPQMWAWLDAFVTQTIN